MEAPVPSHAPQMKAILQPVYGLPDVLRLADVDRPPVADDGVLVRIVAAGVTRGDLLTGKPYPVRAVFGLAAPARPIPGMAIAGRVEAVGRAVTTFRVGDEVLGEVNRGGYAEYVCATEKDLVAKPAGLSFEDAATLPVSATSALQGLRDAGGLQAGQHVLVNGAAGGVGTWAVQIAKALGAVVTGVCSTDNVELVRSLGADHVIDYRTGDYTRGTARYDLIFDLVGNHPLAASRAVLTERGRVVAAAAGGENDWTGPIGPILTGLVSNVYSAQKFASLMALPNRADLLVVCGLIEAGKARAVIDRRYTLADVPDAMRYLGLGRTRGKSVVNV